MDGSSSRNLPTGIGLRDAAAALIAAGHRRFAFVTPDAAPGPAHRDLAALLAKSNLPPARLIETGGSDDKLDRLFFTVFRGTRYPTAVLCADSGSAIVAMESLRLLGFLTPADIVVLQATHGAGETPAPAHVAGFA